jgi:hypothetical protein
LETCAASARLASLENLERNGKPRILRLVKGKLGSLLLFTLVFAVSRIPGMLSQELANFSAAYALMFCGGVYLSRQTAWWLPLGAMLITDIGLNLYYWLNLHTDVWSRPNLSRQLVNYAAFAVIILLGKRFKPKSSFASLLGGGVLGALLFYLITNTASWLTDPGYVKTLAGWIQALITGLPGFPSTWHFFVNTLLSGGLFTGLFVGAMKYSEAAESPQDKVAGAKAENPDPAAEPETEEAKA